jgi:REP element-mobilizing transposase RayT
MNWYHITLSTHNSWLPGDPRGWRSWQHKTHSSGHHRAPPPTGEHQIILDNSRKIAGDTIKFPRSLHPIIGQSIVDYLCAKDYQLLALAVAKTHVHLQIHMPSDQIKIKMGYCKRHISYAIRKQMPGQLWSRGIGIVQIESKTHQHAVYRYILKHREHSAWVWSYRDAKDEGG